MDKATHWFLEKAELQAHPSVTFHIPESQVEDLGAALGPSFCAHQRMEVQSPRQSPAAFLLQGAPGLPEMGLPHCCLFSIAAPSLGASPLVIGIPSPLRILSNWVSSPALSPQHQTHLLGSLWPPQITPD